MCHYEGLIVLLIGYFTVTLLIYILYTLHIKKISVPYLHKILSAF